MKRILTGVACLLVLGEIATAQSVYSFEGLGSLNHQGMPNNVAMGEVGIGTPSVWHINTQNPAFLVYNNFSTFQLGVEVDRRSFSGDDISGNATDGGLRFLGYAFPIMPGKWSSSFGILPYSSVSYNTFSEGSVDGAAPNVRRISDDRGEGGITNFFWSNGFAIKKKLLVGIKANFTFGSIDKSTNIFLFEDVNDSTTIQVSDPINFTELDSYSDFNFQFGLGYRHILKEKTYINLGLIYSPRSRLNGEKELALNRLSSVGREIESVEVSTTDIDFELPNVIGFGISYERLNVLKIGADFETQGWGSVGEPNFFNNSFKFAVGGEWVPDYDNVNSYWKRAKYSLGFNVQRLPYIVNNQSLTDFGINFGASLPVSGFSSLDLAFKFGQLGETTNGLIRESYYKIVLGATINDRWFIKRKYD